MMRRVGQKVDPVSGELFTRRVYEPPPASGEGGEEKEGEGEAEDTEEDEEADEEGDEKKKEKDEFAEDLVSHVHL